MATLAGIKSNLAEQQGIFNNVVEQINDVATIINNGGDLNDIDLQYNNITATIANSQSVLQTLLEQAQTIPPDGAGEPLETRTNIVDLIIKFRAQTERLNRLRVIALGRSNARRLVEQAARNSAGEQVLDSQDGREDNALPVNPPVEPVTGQSTATNSRTPVVKDTTGLANQTGTSEEGGAVPVRRARSQRMPEDDNTSSRQTTVGTSTRREGTVTVASEFLKPIIPTDNKLIGLASSTYTISIYLCSPVEYAALMQRETKTLPTSQLLIQSGGAPLGARNKYFDVDFYIEDFEFSQLIGTQRVGSPHTVSNLNMTIVEPQGITLLNRLKLAARDHIEARCQDISELQQHYLAVIRFYGYDEDGNLINGSQIGNGQTRSDPNSLVEKFIPFLIKNITYKITTKNTEYNLTAVGVNTDIAFSQKRATIPFNLQLGASKVRDLLTGNAGYDGTTVTRGLAEALNSHQDKLVSDGTYDEPDRYIIEIDDTIPELFDARLAKPGRANKSNSPGNLSNTPADKFLTEKSNYDKEARSYNITAGTQVVQLIDLVMRTSTYITDQQNVIFDEKTGKIKPKTSRARTVQWYRVKARSIPRVYDCKRKDFAYDIRYTITPYQINTPRSPYYPPAEYRGVHKLYNYWFTGENTEVLDFEIDVNANYFTVIGNDGKIDESSQGRWAVSQSFQSAPNASQQGGNKGSSIPAAQLSSRLYQLTDVAKAELHLVGDPDWIGQTDVFYQQNVDLNPFTIDGSVNNEASEVLFELRFNPVTDYDIKTGLTNSYLLNTTVATEYGQEQLAQEALTWTATVVHNYFKEGSFTQKLEGLYRTFAGSVNKPTGSNQVAGNISVQDQQIDQTTVQNENEQTTLAANAQSVASIPNGPTKFKQIGSNGNLVNFNIDSTLPYIIVGDTQIYGSQDQLLQYYGNQAIVNNGNNAVSDDAGDSVYKT